MRIQIGSIIGGSLSEGFTFRVRPGIALDSLKTGKFVAIVTPSGTFFSLLTDLRLAVTNPDILLFPPDQEDFLLKHVLTLRDMYTQAHIRPMLMLDVQGNVIPVKTIPAHFAGVYEATAQEITQVFGNQQHDSYFHIGFPLDMNTPICLNLERFAERSNGIFGKTGTGKTFLTRLVLAGLLKQAKTAVLIFDMHNEYGIQARQENSKRNFVKGLKTLFPEKIAIFSLDPEATRRRGCSPDVSISIPYTALTIEDIISLQEELNLHATAVEVLYLLAARYKQEWLTTLLERGHEPKDLAHSIGAHPESLAALYRKLKRLERFSFLSKHATKTLSVVDQMLEYLSRGVSIIVEFGNYTSNLAYLLVANILSRRIYHEYMERTERFLASQKPQDEPVKLIICIEEAHKFLNPSAARQTIFGVIAREMRKYYVSLLIVDQRPSGIDEEVLSQIGSKIVAQLHDEKDIHAVLVGTNNALYLRTIISSLDSKQQVLLLGHAVPMPVVVQTRSYDEAFYQSLQNGVAFKNVDELISEIF